MITKRLPKELKPVKASGAIKDFFNRMMMGRRGTYHREVKLITNVSNATEMQIKNGILKIYNHSQPLAAVNVRNLVNKATDQHYSEFNRKDAQVDLGDNDKYMGTAFTLERGILAVYITGNNKIDIRYAGSTDGQTTYYGGGANLWKGTTIIGTTPTEVLMVGIYDQKVFRISKQFLPLGYATLGEMDNKPLSHLNVIIEDKRYYPDKSVNERTFSYGIYSGEFVLNIEKKGKELH